MLVCALVVFTLASYSRAEKQESAGRIRQLEAELAKHPRRVSLYKQLTALLVEAGQLEASVRWSERGLAITPNDRELTFSLAAGLIGTGRAEQAISRLQKLPPSGKGRFLLGMAYRALQDAASARAALWEAWQLGHQDPYLLYTVVEQDRALGDKDKGLEHFKLFWNRFPDSAWLHMLLADAHFTNSEDAAAEIEYNKALELQPRIPLAHFHLGYLRFQAGDYAEAARHFRSEIAVNPRLGEAYAY